MKATSIVADENQPEKTIDELLAEFKVLTAQTDELRRKMKELTRQIESRGASTPLFGLSSHEIDIPSFKPKPHA